MVRARQPATADQIIALIESLSAEELNTLGSELCDDSSPLANAGFVVIPKEELDALWEIHDRLLKEIVPENLADIQELHLLVTMYRTRYEPIKSLDRSGQTPKARRNEIIRGYLEGQFRREQVYPFMLEHHRDLMLVGKGRRKRPISESSMWRDYRRWLKSPEDQ